MSPQERWGWGWAAWLERAGYSSLAVGTQDKVQHSRDTGRALCNNTHTPPKGPQPLPSTLCTPHPVLRHPLWLFPGLLPTSGLEGTGRCRQPLFLVSGCLRDWRGGYTPRGVVWGPGKTGETAEAAGLAGAARMWGQRTRPLQGQLELTSLGSCVQKAGELLPKERGGLCTQKCDCLVPGLPTLSKTQTQKIHKPGGGNMDPKHETKSMEMSSNGLC